MIEFRHEIEVRLEGQWGSDLDICKSAWVSSGNDHADASEKQQRGLIRALLRDKHGTPFEDGFFKFWVLAPAAVRNEHVRHRLASYSSASARYRIQKPIFYIPPPHRPLRKVEGSKQIQPQYEPYEYEEWCEYATQLADAYTENYKRVEQMLENGFDTTEAVRWLNNDALMMPYIVRLNPRSLMSFLALRTHEKEANHTSYPMYEIEQVARQIEGIFAAHLPLTYEAFNLYGREAP